MTNTKLCRLCDKTLDISEFSDRFIREGRNQCRNCHRSKQRSRYHGSEKRKANVKAYGAKYIKTDAGKISKAKAQMKYRSSGAVKFARRRKYVFKKFGISSHEYDGLLIHQNGSCALCSACFSDESVCVDHDHATGKVRGLLHAKCNSMIGMANDDIRILNSAISYIKEWRIRLGQ